MTEETSPDTAALQLDPQAGYLRTLLAGASGPVPAPVLAALADIPSATAVRHLEQLVRLGAVESTDGNYTIITAGGYENAAYPDPAAWYRVTRWYLASAEHAATLLGAGALPGGEKIGEDCDRPPAPMHTPADAIAWYHATHSQLLRAVDRACAADEVETAWRLALLTANIAAIAGPAGAWEQLLALGRGAAHRSGEEGAEAMILEYTGALLAHEGDTAQARDAQSDALKLRTEARDGPGIIRSHIAIGLIHLGTGDLTRADDHFTHALDLATAIGAEQSAATARAHLGATLTAAGDIERARVLLRGAARYFRAHEPGYHLAGVLAELAATYRVEGEHARALRLANDAVAQATRTQIPAYLPAPLCELARIHTAIGAPAPALSAYSEARSIHAALGDVTRAVLLDEEIDAIVRQRTKPGH